MSDLTSEEFSTVSEEDLLKFLETQPVPLSQFANQRPGVPPVGGVEPSVAEPTVPPASDSAPPTPEPEPEPEPESSPEPETQPEGEPEAAPDTAAPESPPEPSEDYLELEGERYLRSQVTAAARFQRMLAGDPDLQRLLQTYLAGSQEVTQAAPTPAATTLPQPAAPAEPAVTEIDLEDPSVRALYNLVQAQTAQIDELRTNLNSNVNAQLARARQETNGLWLRASDSFAKDHSLTREEVDQLGNVAARLNVMPALMQGIDPITGTPVTPDPIKAFDRALEIAMFQVPEFRDREFKRSVQVQQEESKKRKLLGAVGGSSGSVARTNPPPQPGTPEARRAMVAEVAAMMNGEWSDPTAN